MIVGVVFSLYGIKSLSKTEDYKFNDGDKIFWGLISVFWILIVGIVIVGYVPRFLGKIISKKIENENCGKT